MAAFTIPVSAEPSQIFQMKLTGETYFIELKFNQLTDQWSISLLDANRGYIFRGRSVVLGTNLIRNTDPEKVPGALLIALDNEGNATEPDFDRLVDGRVTLLYGDSI